MAVLRLTKTSVIFVGISVVSCAVMLSVEQRNAFAMSVMKKKILKSVLDSQNVSGDMLLSFLKRHKRIHVKCRSAFRVSHSEYFVVVF